MIEDQEYLSCPDLESSLYLAPNEVRACCKRFFVDGEQRGDVVLLNAIAEDVTIDNIARARQSLVSDINANKKNPCQGCPFLEKKNWGQKKKDKVHAISFEQSSVCNMKCVYCSEMFYGGLSESYDVKGLFKELLTSGALEDCHSIVWGGGEPTLRKDFDSFLIEVTDSGDWTQRVFTNALKFSNAIARLLESSEIFITTSIDAGSNTVFNKVRGYRGRRLKSLHQLVEVRRYKCLANDASTFLQKTTLVMKKLRNFLD